VHKLIEKSDIAFVDITGPHLAHVPPIFHMDIPELELLKTQYPTKRLVPIHMTDATRAKLADQGHNPPSDNEEFNI
jgi:hypothetical protein